MYYVAKQLWSKLFAGKPFPPDDAAGRRITIKSVLDELGKDHGKPENIVADAKQDRGQDQDLHPRQEDPDAAGPGRVQGHRDARVPARLLGRVPEPRPAARPEGQQPLRRRTAAEGLDAGPHRDVPPRVQLGDAADPHHPRGVSGALRPARVLEPLPVAGAEGALVGRVRGGLGRVHRADDARPGLRRRRPVAAAAPVEVLPCGR